MTSEEERQIADQPLLSEFMKNGRYLPPVMRDFHDQKEIFRAIHGLTGWNEGEGWGREIPWVNGQIYTIDLFLHFMARHGYTLQRSRAKVPFHDLDEKVARYSREEREASAVALKAYIASRAAARSDPAPASEEQL